MQFAHTLGAGGPEIEFLIVAAAMLVLGVIFFMQKAVKPVVSVILVVGAFAMGVGAFAAGGSSDTGPTGSDCVAENSSNDQTSLIIAAPRNGDSVAADEPFALEIELEGGTGDAADGHFDVSVDGQLETMTSQPDPDVTFSAGDHALRVEYVTSRHEPFDPPVYDIVCVTAE
jgi:hypothetical protein